MELSEKVENFNGSGAAVAGFGGIGLFLMAIFLLVLFSLFRHGRNDERTEGCADKMTWARYANFVDPEMSRTHLDQARDTGQIRKDLAVDNGNVLCAIDRQTGSLLLNQEKIARDQENLVQNVAREQERYFYQAQLDGKNEKLAEQREKLLMLDNTLQHERNANLSQRLHQETMAAIANQSCIVNNRITSIEGQMIKQPPFYPLGGVACMTPCPPYGYSAASTGCGSCA